MFYKWGTFLFVTISFMHIHVYAHIYIYIIPFFFLKQCIYIYICIYLVRRIGVSGLVYSINWSPGYIFTYLHAYFFYIYILVLVHNRSSWFTTAVAIAILCCIRARRLRTAYFISCALGIIRRSVGLVVGLPRLLICLCFASGWEPPCHHGHTTS